MSKATNKEHGKILFFRVLEMGQNQVEEVMIFVLKTWTLS